MTADIAMITAQAVALLAPSLPFLLKLGEGAAEEAGSRLGAEVWERAKSVWAHLLPAVEPDKRAQGAAEELAADPENVDLQAQLRVQLGRLLREDTSLAMGVARLLDPERQASASFTGVVQTGPVTDSETYGIVFGSVNRNQPTPRRGRPSSKDVEG